MSLICFDYIGVVILGSRFLARDRALLETWLQFVAILIISPFLTKKNYIEGWENTSGNMNPIQYI